MNKIKSVFYNNEDILIGDLYCWIPKDVYIVNTNNKTNNFEDYDAIGEDLCGITYNFLTGNTEIGDGLFHVNIIKNKKKEKIGSFSIYSGSYGIFKFNDIYDLNKDEIENDIKNNYCILIKNFSGEIYTYNHEHTGDVIIESKGNINFKIKFSWYYNKNL